MPLVQCFQEKLGPSRDVAAALKDEEAYLNPTSGKIKTWVLVFCQFMVPFSIFVQDIVTDGLLTGEYFKKWKNYSGLSTKNLCTFNDFISDGLYSTAFSQVFQKRVATSRFDDKARINGDFL